MRTPGNKNVKVFLKKLRTLRNRLNNRIETLKADLDNLTISYTNKHPDVKAIKRVLRELEANLEDKKTEEVTIIETESVEITKTVPSVKKEVFTSEELTTVSKTYHSIEATKLYVEEHFFQLQFHYAL